MKKLFPTIALALLVLAGPPVLAAGPTSLANESGSVPESGVGLMTGGAAMLVGGTALLVTSSYLTATRSPDLAVAIVGSGALMAAGSTFIWLGNRRARRLRTWSEQTGLRPPPEGRALLISGLVVGGGGAISMAAYGLMSTGDCETHCFDPDLAAWFGPAGAALGVGIAMIIGSALLHSRSRKWRASHELAKVRLAPSLAFSPRGAHFGVALRF